MKRSSVIAILACAPVLLGQAPSPVVIHPPPFAATCPPVTEASASARVERPALAVGGKLDVLLVGSATMLGPNGKPEDAFTYRAVQALAAARPEAGIGLVARNARGALASDMLAVLRTELAAHRYPIVLWQAGTVEAAKSVPVEPFAKTLADGARLVADAKGALILVDSQFTRMLQSRANVGPYEAAMRDAASMPGVVLFRRYDLTKDWLESGQIDLEHAPTGERQKMADRLNECLAGALAGVLAEVAPDPAPSK